MTPSDIARHRKALGLSHREFERALGYDREGKTTKALEGGQDEKGKPFKLTGAAEKALLYLLAMKSAYEEIGKYDYVGTVGVFSAEEILRKALPEGLR